MTLWYRFCRDLVFGLSRLAWGLRVVGRDNLPTEGPVIIACNHISLLDPPVLGSSIPRESGFVAKRDLFANPGMARLLGSLNSIPIDRSRLSMETMDLLAEFLRSGRALVFFPEGTRSRSGTLRAGKVGIGVLLQKCPVPVVPAYIEGTNAPFRNLFRRGRVRVAFGPPFALPRDDSSSSDRRAHARHVAETVMARIRELQEEANAS
ncbi:MAG: 1-acyl-sn-glycerol-3-phosphate acyltransferase [Gemmatimonadota bacterium]|nr:MAG: 1-acyl-sn-glycerol-3-phosphate acyltransferase [Gemmatimonadota bacterium]